MHPDSHSLDASFEATGNRPDTASTGSLRDQAVEDFNSFFEKLSALDNLQWSSEPAPAAATPKADPAATPPAARRAAPAPSASAPLNSGRVAMPGAKPRMTVVKSDTDLAAPPAEAALPGAKGVPLPAGVPRGRVTARDVARFLKMTLVGLLLFALGLGAGWAALSLPGHFDRGMPSFSQLMERTRGLTATRSDGMANAGEAAQEGADPLRVVEAGRAAGIAGATSAASASTQAAAKSDGKAAHPAAAPVAGRSPAKAPTGAPAKAAPKAIAQAVAQSPVTPADESTDSTVDATSDGDGAAPGTAAADGIQLPVVSQSTPPAPAIATRATANAAATPTVATTPGAPQFTLQVGACSSYACVENYRRMLLTKVSSGAIHVLTQPRSDGSGSIQRIRIEPLERARAEQLKAELTALDARFKGAYLIALH